MVIKKRALSILKNIRKDKKRKERNKAIKIKAKSSFKMAIKSIEKGKKEEGIKNLSLAFKNIDKAREKRVFHKNKAARLKSKLSKRLIV